MTDEKKQDPWWVATFGKDNSVKRDIFMEKYMTKVNTKDAYTIRILAKYVIRGFEPYETMVHHEEFYNFVQRFGPLESSFTKAKESLFDSSNYLQTWFHGALSREEAEKRLGDANGVFLVRYSEKFPTKLTIMYTSTRDGQFHVKNILVYNSDKGFTLYDGVSTPDPNEPPKYFANLQALIDGFKAKLVKPIASPILEYIKHHDKPGSQATSYQVPDFTKEGRYSSFVEGGKTGAVADKPKDDKYQHFPHERKPSTGGHEPGAKHADYSKFPGKDGKGDKDGKGGGDGHHLSVGK